MAQPEDSPRTPAELRALRELLADGRRGEARDLADSMVSRVGADGGSIGGELVDLLFEVLGPPPDASASALGDSQPIENRRIGPYRLLRVLGQGAQGQVFLAEDTRLQRRVALKLLANSLANSSESLVRFRREAEVASRLDDPGICAVYEAGQAEGVHYIAMRYVEGTSLAQAIRTTREETTEGTSCATVELPPGAVQDPSTSGVSSASVGRKPLLRAVHMVERVARSLHVAHEAGLIHRDIKPGNIMITAGGDPVILDFGLAREEESELQSLTMPGDFVGTPAYVSPEQIANDAEPVDRRTDVYSLGVTLFECVTLERPFDAPTREGLFRRILNGERSDPITLNPQVRSDLKVILDTALELDQSRRYQTAEDFAEDLRRYRSFEPIQARPAGPVLRFHRWLQRNPVLATSTLALFVTLVCGLILSLVLLERVDDQKQLTEDALWESLVDQARAGRWSGRSGQRFTSLEALSRAALLRPTAEIRNEAIACMALPDLLPESGWDDYPEGTVAVGYDPEFRIRARGDDQGQVIVERMSDGDQLLQISGDGTTVQSLHLSSDGSILAVCRGRDFWAPYGMTVWDIATGAQLFSVDDAHFRAMDISPDSQRLCSAHKMRDGILIRILSLPDCEELQRIGPFSSASVVRFAPDGRRVAITTERGQQVLVWDLATNDVVIRRTTDATRGLGWHPNGRLLAAGVGHDIHVWDLEVPGAPLRVLKGHQNAVMSIAFAQRGNALLSVSWDSTMRLWDPMAGRQVVMVNSHFGDIQLSSDDRLVAFRGRDPGGALYRVATEAERVWLRSETGEVDVWDMDFSPDGRLLVATCGDGIRLWSTDSGHPVGFLPVGGREASVYFRADGTGLLSSAGGVLLAWPMRARAEGRVQGIGAPDILLRGSDQTRCSLAREAPVAAYGRDGLTVSIVNLESGRERVQLRHPSVRYLDLSADGRWCATGSYGGEDIKVWDAANGGLLATIPISETARAQFSPNAEWLAVSWGGNCSLFETGTWTLSHRIERDPRTTSVGALAFAPDGRTLALAYSQYEIALVSPGDGRRFARLEMPDLSPIQNLRFDHEGARLAAASRNGVVLWDLRLIRSRLTSMGLDWDLPPYPDAGEEPREPVRVDSSFDEITFRYRVLESYPYTEDPTDPIWARESRPRVAMLCNQLAWLLVERGRSSDMEDALLLALRSDRLEPGKHPTLNSLGVIYFRLDRLDESMQAFERANAARGEATAWDLYFMAMIEHRNGQATAALRLFEEADRWLRLRARPNEIAELEEFRVEAKAELAQ